jgi:hypothetical protein
MFLREIAGQKVGATIWQWQPLVSNRWHRGIGGDDDQRQIIQLDVETFVPLALSERPLPKEGAAGNGTAAQVHASVSNGTVKLTAVRQRNTPTKVPQAPCLLENTQTRKIAWVLTRVLTFSPSHCKFAGRKS